MKFVIPCKFDPNNPIIFDCVKSIREHQPDAIIVVVDSASDDKAYLQDIDADFIGDWDNSGYTLAAYKWAYDQDQNTEHWALIHDSLIIRSAVPDPEPLLTVRHFESATTPWGWDGNNISLDQWAYVAVGERFPITNQYTGILGPMWFCTRQVMEDLTTLGLFDIRVSDKYQLCAMERIVGIALQHLGYDPSVSLQGQMNGFYDPYDSSVVEKCFLNRL